MVAEQTTGVWGPAEKLDLSVEWPAARKSVPQARIDALNAELFTLAEREGAVRDLFNCLRRHMNEAKIAVRGPDSTSAKGWSYQWIPDGPVQVAAANSLAKILRLMPQSAGVTVNNGPQQTLNVTTGERLSELDAIGVPRDEIAKACQDLLAATSSPKEPTEGKSVS